MFVPEGELPGFFSSIIFVYSIEERLPQKVSEIEIEYCIFHCRACIHGGRCVSFNVLYDPAHHQLCAKVVNKVVDNLCVTWDYMINFWMRNSRRLWNRHVSAFIFNRQI